ncbi:hypothetical protein D3C79_283990 [compost metagenome]
MVFNQRSEAQSFDILRGIENKIDLAVGVSMGLDALFEVPQNQVDRQLGMLAGILVQG